MQVRTATLVSLVCAVLAGCNSGDDAPAKGATSTPGAVVATVVSHGVTTSITQQELAPLVSKGMDRANAVDLTINRVVAARLAEQQYGPQVEQALNGLKTEVAASIFASNKQAELEKSITDADINRRYNETVGTADFNGYQLKFALYPTLDEANSGRAAALKGEGGALKAFQPLAADKDGQSQYVPRGQIPYELGVFVAKLKRGEYTEAKVTRNGYLVLQLQDIKQNVKPELSAIKNDIRKLLAEEQMIKLVTEARKAAAITLK